MTARLADVLARSVASHCTDCLKRAEIPHPAFAASHPIEGLDREYDTIVLEFEPRQLRPERGQSITQPVVLSQSRSGPAQSVGELVREALLLLHALSYCNGYAFHENFPFWNGTLAQADPPTGAMPPKTGVRFPRVLLDWNPRYAGSLDMFEASVLAVLITPSSRRISRDGQKLLASIREFQVSSPEKKNPIECVVSIRFARAAKDTKSLVDSVISSAKALATSATTAASRIQTEFTWVGVSVSGCRSIQYLHRGLVTLANLKLLRRLCVSLPASIALNIALPRSSPNGRRTPKEASREPLAAFLILAIGISGTELLGRLAVLDLTYSSNGRTTPAALDFASLCTLLPHSRSLQTLRVPLEAKNDLLWIVHAATHPLTRTTRWRTLHLSNFAYQWPQLDRLVASSSLLAELWTETTNPFTTSTSTTDARAPPDYYVRRTAKIAQDVQFFSPDKTKTFVQLVPGCEVELCDTTTPLDELVLESGDPDLDDVAVVVAGVGLGWVHKRHLTQLVDKRYEGMLRSCITTLVLANRVGTVTDVSRILSFFGPTLTHLSAYRAPRFAIDDATRMCPHLETLEMAVLSQEEDHEVKDFPVLRRLRSVGLVCSDLVSLISCLEWLKRFPCLNSVRVRFDRHLPAYHVRLGEIEDHLAQLVTARARTLRSLTTIYLKVPPTTQVGGDDRLSCDASSKRALLSVLHRARDEAPESQSALARVGSDVVRLVFDFAGPSMTRRVLQGYDIWPSDWYDSHSLY